MEGIWSQYTIEAWVDFFSPETDVTWRREAEKDGEGGENAQTRTGYAKAGNRGTSRSP